MKGADRLRSWLDRDRDVTGVPHPRVFFVRVAGKGLRLDAASTASTFADGGFEVVPSLKSKGKEGELNAETPRPGRGKRRTQSGGRASMGNCSMEVDYCQGISTII